MLRKLSISVLQVGCFTGEWEVQRLNGRIEDRQNTTDLDLQQVNHVFGQAAKLFALTLNPRRDP